MVLAVTTEPAAACVCDSGLVPAVDFTGVVVEDLGYSEGGGSIGRETHAWRFDVTEARLGVDGDKVRISMVVGEVRNADGSGTSGGCGMDDNLIVGESYDVTSVGLERMSSCGSQVDGPRSEVPVRGEEDDERLRDLMVIFGTGAIVLLLAGVLVVRTGRRS